MAYSDEAVKSKLNTLNETQDSIVTVAQWIMFHRRHADRTAALWLSRLQDSPTAAKRLTLIYLANEVVQQSRARSKTEFLVAFEPVVSEATALAYKSASSDVREKLRRVVEVWRQRNVFDRSIQETTEQRLREIDEQRAGKSGGGRLGGSLFGAGSTPAELGDVAKSQIAVNKSEANTNPALDKAKVEYEKLMDPHAEAPALPVHAHKLRELVKTLALARVTVEQSIKVRKELLSGLEKLVKSNKAKLAEEETALADLAAKSKTTESKKDAVEDAIVQGVANENRLNGSGHTGSEDVHAPEVEGFTPPAPEVESFTPQPEELTMNGDPAPLIGENGDAAANLSTTTGAENIHEQPPNRNEPPPAFEPQPASISQDSAAAAADSFLEDLGASGTIRFGTREVATDVTGDAGDPRLKRRKLNHHVENDADDEVFGAAAAGVDEDSISAMLGTTEELGREADVSSYGW